MSDCIFCQIISGKVPSTRIYEDEHALSFMDIFPGCEGHILVIPKFHAENIFTLPPTDLIYTMTTVQKVAIAIQKTLKVEGLNIFQSNGKIAFQTVFHVHFHLLPRRLGDDIVQPWRPKPAVEEQLEKLAEQIRQGF